MHAHLPQRHFVHAFVFLTAVTPMEWSCDSIGIVSFVHGGDDNASRWQLRIRVSRFTFHIVWMLLSVAGVSMVYGGPIWAYPLVLLLAMIAAVFVVAYPTDNSLRKTLALFGALLALGASSRFVMHGFTQLVVNESLAVLMSGVACIWAAVFPHRDVRDATS